MTRSGAKAGRPQGNLRLLRVGESLRHALSEVFMRGELNDPGLEGVSITVTEVRPSPDLRHGHVFIMPLGGFEAAAVIQTLNRTSGYLGHLIADRVRMKYTPRLVFHLDASFDAAGRIDSLLRDPHVAQDLARPRDSFEDDDDAGYPADSDD